MASDMAVAKTSPNSFEEIFDGVNARYCNINGKYYMSIRDLIMGMCIENSTMDKETWEKACDRASNIWTKNIDKKKKEELAEYLETFKFEGNIFFKVFEYCFA